MMNSQQRQGNRTGNDDGSDQQLPISNVIRIMRGILPVHVKISDDAKETVQECVSEYISFITGEANDRCRREQRRTVTAEDILWAMGKLGFDDYVDPLTLFMNRYREAESHRTAAAIRDPLFKPPPADHAEIYRDPHGASSSQPTYDPFAQFKRR